MRHEASIQFGAKVLSERQRGYAQVKRELWGIVSADKDYVIRTEVIIEMDCLPILGIVFGCATPAMAMLKWLAYIQSMSPEIRHMFEKDNMMADMLSRAWYGDEDVMVSEDEEVGVDFFESVYVTTRAGSTPALNEFNEGEYDGEWLQIGRFLMMMTPDATWTKDEAAVSKRKRTGSSYGTGTYGGTLRSEAVSHSA